MMLGDVFRTIAAMHVILQAGVVSSCWSRGDVAVSITGEISLCKQMPLFILCPSSS